MMRVEDVKMYVRLNFERGVNTPYYMMRVEDVKM